MSKIMTPLCPLTCGIYRNGSHSLAATWVPMPKHPHPHPHPLTQTGNSRKQAGVTGAGFCGNEPAWANQCLCTSRGAATQAARHVRAQARSHAHAGMCTHRRVLSSVHRQRLGDDERRVRKLPDRQLLPAAQRRRKALQVHAQGCFNRATTYPTQTHTAGGVGLSTRQIWSVTGFGAWRGTANGKLKHCQQWNGGARWTWPPGDVRAHLDLLYAQCMHICWPMIREGSEDGNPALILIAKGRTTVNCAAILSRLTLGWHFRPLRCTALSHAICSSFWCL